MTVAALRAITTVEEYIGGNTYYNRLVNSVDEIVEAQDSPNYDLTISLHGHIDCGNDDHNNRRQFTDHYSIMIGHIDYFSV